MFEREVQVAGEIARAAGAGVLEAYGTDLHIAYKSPGDPVTAADLRASEQIVDGLRRAFPDDGVVTEEDPDTRASQRAGRCWYVDPIDGTKEFIQRTGQFAVMIGLAVNGEATVGAIYEPTRAVLYSGVVGQGAFAHSDDGAPPRPLHVSERSDPSTLRLTSSRANRTEAIDYLVAELGITDEIRSGSAGVKVGHIVERRADLYVHAWRHSSAWDTCGPEAVLRAAGGVMTDLRGEPFVYGAGDDGDLHNPYGILACTRAAFPGVRSAALELGVRAGLFER